jgi:hypothetical protein
MYYNVDSPKGSSIMEEMQAKLVTWSDARGVKGVMNIREIQPEDVGLTEQVITVTGGEASYTLTRDVKENCAIIIGGFYVNDTILREVDVWRGNAKLHNWSIQDVYNLRDKAGVRSDYVFWGPGETLKLIFYPKATDTADQSSATWFEGFVLVPDMQSSATRSV